MLTPRLMTEGSLGARVCQIRRRRGPPPAHPHVLNGAPAPSPAGGAPSAARRRKVA